MKRNLWVWRRQIAEAQADDWLERLEWIGPQRALVLTKPGSTRARVEVYGSSRREADRLQREHGGRLASVTPKQLLPPAARRPIRVNATLYVAGDTKTAQRLRREKPDARILLIPASVAFGSGEHATTGMVLRYLGRHRSLVARSAMLDLGTGSGILALTARALGAGRVAAMDNDADCVRVSRENEQANFGGKSTIRWQRAELDGYQAHGPFSLVTANLFSELLINHAPAIWSMVAPGGQLLLSGILYTQAAAVTRAFRKQSGSHFLIRQHKGKWTLLAFERKW